MSIREIISWLEERVQVTQFWLHELADVAAWQVNWLDARVELVIFSLVLYGWLIYGVREFAKDVVTQMSDDEERKDLAGFILRWLFLVGVILFLIWFVGTKKGP